MTLKLTSSMLAPSRQARRGRAFRTPPGSKDSNGKEESLGAAGALPGYFYALRFLLLFYNLTMPPSKWSMLLIPLAAGLALGLIYGWVIDPVQFIDTTPETLRADYRTDYVLMVAEAYQTEKDPGLAARRLGIFGSQPPADIVKGALQTGRDNGYASSDLILLQELFSAMQSYQPVILPVGTAP